MRLKPKEIRAFLGAMELLGWGTATLSFSGEEEGSIQINDENLPLKRFPEGDLIIQVAPDTTIRVGRGLEVEPESQEEIQMDLQWDLTGLRLLKSLSEAFMRPIEFELFGNPILLDGELIVGRAFVESYGSGLLIGYPSVLCLLFSLPDGYEVRLRITIPRETLLEAVFEKALLGETSPDGEDN